MRIIFFGTPQPAADILKLLLQGEHKVVGVVSQPDRPKGRGLIVGFSPVKELALRHALPLEQPEKLKGNDALKRFLSDLKPDLAVVVAYGKIIPAELLALPQKGFINVHASLLPKYRGAAPIQWALLNGEKETGITVFKLVEQLDAGPIIAQRAVPVAIDDNSETLSKKIFSAGEGALQEALSLLERGQAGFRAQDESKVTYAPLIAKESGAIDWKKSAGEIHDRVRALVAWPGAATLLGGKPLKILRSGIGVMDLAAQSKEPGTIVQLVKDDGFIVATGRGDLLVREVQPAGGKKMDAYAFALGHRLNVGTVLPN
ncbi:MAG TPA: methionyl-tRNA formyltransferase [Candidatus Sulfotelmatobacter sp.]|nr:methionyl-tRNA formyltransferase [Candidatus Sulfotelmatobacter sp.]